MHIPIPTASPSAPRPVPKAPKETNACDDVSQHSFLILALAAETVVCNMERVVALQQVWVEDFARIVQGLRTMSAQSCGARRTYQGSNGIDKSGSGFYNSSHPEGAQSLCCEQELQRDSPEKDPAAAKKSWTRVWKRRSWTPTSTPSVALVKPKRFSAPDAFTRKGMECRCRYVVKLEEIQHLLVQVVKPDTGHLPETVQQMAIALLCDEVEAWTSSVEMIRTAPATAAKENKSSSSRYSIFARSAAKGRLESEDASSP
ncbi:hypothetical protein CB0940_05867 [Cercospora beticola]|uniref:Uncharacterized protein n=1 Tax=Cercospora beticola TaxID=122368 RepID=A0A2G5HYC4_CERBT|nr:hypothetical protein CB0940_05867 [Cercospora beticola]PIA97491.1 hypothetical protein CB0940_05867 [Cercospora beticola]WPA98460.1 hypothetical protein RHO25_003072 [Cercospora beticola]